MENIIGKRFEKLIVLKFSHRSNGRLFFKCLCDCGRITYVSSANLRAKGVKSCGCLRKKHGHATYYRQSKEYRTWAAVKTRCLNKNKNRYKDYGGRGIKICDRWLESFENFLEDMGKCPGPKYSIERIDNNGDYTTENCKWATSREQYRNTRRNRWLEFNGEKMILSDWARRIKIDPESLSWRIKRGQTLSDIFNDYLRSSRISVETKQIIISLLRKSP